jgi:hypothetical protein
MSCSISHARRSADFLSANPVDSRNSWPLIVFRRYQIPPRFLKAIAHPLAHPAIKSLSIESNDPTAPNEWNLPTTDAVIDRMPAHAEVLSRGVDVEPARLDDRSGNDVLRFHDGTPSGAEGVGGRGDRLPP